jgi:N-ethylmaleimide reductase
MWTDQSQMQPFPTPEEMSAEDIKTAIEEFTNACRLADRAGFDGVEFHAANGYLIEQFINPNTNQREDEYGGSLENRIRFALDIVRGAVEVLGEDRVGIRLSPYGAFNDMGVYDEVDETYSTICEALDEMETGYVHIVDHSSMGAPEVSPTVKALIREKFQGAVILAGGYDAARAESDLNDDKGDLVAFGKPFIANPNLVEKMKSGAPLLEPDENTFYTPGEEGYISYPVD